MGSRSALSQQQWLSLWFCFGSLIIKARTSFTIPVISKCWDYAFAATDTSLISWLSSQVNSERCTPLRPAPTIRLREARLATSTSSNIENWWERDDRWRHNARHITSFVKKKRGKRCCWNCNIWPNWFSSHQSYYCLYYNGLPEIVRKRSMLPVKY